MKKMILFTLALMMMGSMQAQEVISLPPVFRNGVTQIEGHGFRLRASSSFMTSSS